ncbi:MAG: hypothetical protein KDA81_09505 [Planctomycetaceae bacterium]|nr:hypothetical protein [Planctomycetaceae bacterium]
MNKISKLRLGLLIGVLLSLALVWFWKAGGISQFRDSRLAGVEPGDHVAVQPVAGMYSLIIYQNAAVTDAGKELTELLAPLPKVAAVYPLSIIIRDPTTGEETSIANRDLYVVEIVKHRPQVMTVKNAVEPTIDQLEQARFADRELPQFRDLIDAAMLQDEPVTAGLFNTIQGRTVDEILEEYSPLLGLTVEEYTRSTSDGAEVQATNVEFIRRYLDDLVWQPDEKPSPELQVLARAASEVTDDEVIHVFADLIEISSTNAWRLTTPLTERLDQFDSSDFAAVTTMIARERLLKATGRLGRNELDRFMGTAERFWIYLKENPTCLVPGSRLVARIRSHVPIDQREAVYRRFVMNTDCPDLIVHIFGTEFHRERGWNFRGNSLYALLTSTQRRQFEADMNLTAFHALSAMRSDPMYSDAVLALMSVARTGEAEVGTPRGWLLTGIKLNLNEPRYYSHYRNSLDPKWGGSHEAMIHFADACAGCIRTDIATLYSVVDTLEFYVKLSGGRGWNRPEVEAILRKLIANLSNGSDADESTSAWIDYELCHVAAIACREGNLQIAREAFDSLNQDPEQLWFSHYQLGPVSDVRQRVYSLTSPVGELVGRLSEICDAGFPEQSDFTVAESLINQIRAGDRSPDVETVCVQAEAAIEFVKQFQSGVWVDASFLPEKGLWKIQPEHCHIRDENQLEMGSIAGHTLSSQLRVRLPLPYEMEVKILLEDNGDRTFSQGGLTIEDEERPAYRDSGIYAFVQSDLESVFLRDTKSGSTVELPSGKIRDVNEVYVRAEIGNVAVKINDSEQLSKSVSLSNPNPYIRLSTLAGRKNVFQHVRIRKLSIPEP